MNASDLLNEAIRNLEAYCTSGLRGFGQKAYDRLRAGGMTETSLGRFEDWDEDFAGRLYSYLVSE